MIISSMIVMTDHVREMRHVLICCPYISGFFKSYYYVNTVRDVDWISLVPDRNVWKAPLNMVMSFHVVLEAGKYVANGATITGIFKKKKSVTLKFAAQ